MSPRFKERLAVAHSEVRAKARFLRRVRRLYCALVWREVVADTTNATIDACALKMIENGLYAPSACKVTALRHARYAILTRAWRLSTKPHERRYGRNDWHHWCKRFGFESWHWRRPADLRAIA